MLDTIIVAMYVLFESTQPSGLHTQTQMRLTGFETLAQCEAAIPEVQALVTGRNVENAYIICVEEGTEGGA